MAERQEQGYIELQRKRVGRRRRHPDPIAPPVQRRPYHHLVGTAYDAARLGTAFVEQLPEDKVV